ncbi:DNA-directed RNA polymerase [Geomicrobium halophilum]|uniref:DNA-directed RNA polymerase n=1 Tax=Geomicrobium halophilum TaxID=549000 RepID=A0A841PMD6_9BACL|nr:sigma-70 family RNA polymerase sigma factor [Geomicrobium halophilum]MBB6449899.1 DNA-directed RNA polymerase [Geomicrobium halophilum]
MSIFQSQSTDPAGFEQIYHDYTPLVRGMIRRLRIHSNHEDFLQAGYLGLWYAYRDYDEVKGSFSSYAFIRVRGEMMTMLRKDVRHQDRHVCSTELESLQDTYLEYLGTSDMEALAPYLDYLTRREQLWVVEHAIHDQAPRMIAAKYNVSNETVKGWRKNALKKLRKQYSKQNTDREFRDC